MSGPSTETTVRDPDPTPAQRRVPRRASAGADAAVGDLAGSFGLGLGFDDAEEGWDRIVVRCYWIVTALVVGVVVYHGLRSTATHWLPVGDDAFLTVRSRAVFSAHPPLLSSASSAGAGAAVTYNHPGAAVLWFTAPFVRLSGPSGMAAGVAVLNGLMVLAAAVCARRAARAAVAAGVLAATAGLVWSMGSQVLVDPWNPHVATLALLALLVATWAVLGGVRSAAPVGVAAGAVAAQTHLSFVAVAGSLVLVLLAVVVLRSFRAVDPATRRSWRLAGIGAVGAGIVVLAPTIVEQLAHGTDGNLARIVEGSGSSAVTVAPSQALSVAVAVLVRPPWFLRDSWGMSMFSTDLPGPALTAAGAAVLVVVVLLATLAAWRRRDRAIVAMVGVAASAVVVGVVASLAYPLRIGVPIAYFRWLWPSAAVLATAVAVPVLEAGVRVIGRHRPAVLARAGAAVMLLAATGFTVLTVPVANDDLAGSGQWAQRLSREMLEQAGPLLHRIDGAVEVVPSLQEGPLMAFTGALVDDLDAHGIDVRSADPVIVQQIGDQHRATGREPWVLVMTGPDVADAAGPAGGTRLGTVRALSPAERRALDAELARTESDLRGATAVLTPAGRATGDPALESLAGPIRHADLFLHDRVLADALRHGLLRIEARPGVHLEPDAVADLSERAFHADGRTFALWLVPRADWEHSR